MNCKPIGELPYDLFIQIIGRLSNEQINWPDKEVLDVFEQCISALLLSFNKNQRFCNGQTHYSTVGHAVVNLQKRIDRWIEFNVRNRGNYD